MLAFTTDTWTSRANDRYTSLTLHYLDGNFDIKSYTLDIFCMPKAHTSEDLQSLLQTSIVEWGLDKCGIKIFFVTDNTAKIVEAIRLGRTWERIPCFAHTLQLVIKDAIEDSKELVRILKKCKDIVSFFHRSASATDKLRKQQQRDSPDCEPLKLIGNLETRWNSQFDMLHRLLQVKRSINTVLGERRMRKNINSCEWSMINEYCKSLKIFKEATLLLTIENTPTLPRYIPAIHGLQNELTHTTENKDTPPTKLKNNLLLHLNTRFKFIEGCNSLIIAMVMDPRIKDRSLAGEKKEAAHNLLYLIATEYLDVSDEHETSVSPNQPSVSSPSGSLFVFFEGFHTVEENTNDTAGTALHKEIKVYMEDKIVPNDTSITKWWRENAARYPLLAPVAKQFLGIPATQAHSERLFSLAGNIINEKRASLLSEKVEQICFLCANVGK